LAHVPVQQSVSSEQESPGCAQKEEGWQVPLAQTPEQQSPPPPHWFPSVLHPLLREAHVPLTQFLLQQSLLPPQD
jgi:hypothetical protein